MLVTASPSGVEELFVTLGVPVTGSVPPTDAVMPPMDELVRLFTGYGCEILGPPLARRPVLAESGCRLREG